MTALDAPTTAGAAAPSPAAAPDPTTPARAAVTISDSGCPGGHHTETDQPEAMQP